MNLKLSTTFGLVLATISLVVIGVVIIQKDFLATAKQEKAKTVSTEGYKEVEIWDLHLYPRAFPEGELLKVPGYLVKCENPKQEVRDAAQGKGIFLLRRYPARGKHDDDTQQIILFIDPGTKVVLNSKVSVWGAWQHIRIRCCKTGYLVVDKITPAK